MAEYYTAPTSTSEGAPSEPDAMLGNDQNYSHSVSAPGGVEHQLWADPSGLGRTTFLIIHDRALSQHETDGNDPTGCHPLSPGEYLRGNFANLVGGIAFSSVAVPYQTSKIAHPEKFKFTSIMARKMERDSTSNAGYDVLVDESIRVTYRNCNGGKPYIDALHAIGLVYSDHLIAVASARIQGASGVEIVQLQDVSGVRKAASGREYFKTGLHNGFRWRDTLVAAWEQLGRQAGINEVIIQSNENNRYKEIYDAEEPVYDQVAVRAGYVRDHTTKNFHKLLS